MITKEQFDALKIGDVLITPQGIRRPVLNKTKIYVTMAKLHNSGFASPNTLSGYHQVKDCSIEKYS